MHIQDLLSLPITSSKLKNLKEEILCFRFKVASFHESIEDQPNNKVIKCGLDCAMQTNWIELQSMQDIAGPKIEKYLRQVKSNIQRYQLEWHP